ncbi:putative nuclease HARBI1 [Episyrphus balteatus]|nr:putative nuclease HARBI1 [Episyrphus balteatus]
MIFTNVVARWPGSSHDATIFNCCKVKNIMERQSGLYSDCFILGDSAYPQKSYLMTPLLNPNGTAEQLYNESQIRSRGVIEKAFGILKRRFPILAYGARLKLSTVLTIIIATCTLHNILRQNNILEDPPESLDFNNEDLERVINAGQIDVDHSSRQNNARTNSSNLNMQKRMNLINDYFGRL